MNGSTKFPLIFSVHKASVDAMVLSWILSCVFRIDLDGSGSMKPLYVYCNMSTAAPDAQGVTTVTHNFHEVQLGQAKAGGVKYEVQYRQFGRAELKKLVDISQQCKQFISYKCKNAPLKYAMTLTHIHCNYTPIQCRYFGHFFMPSRLFNFFHLQGSLDVYHFVWEWSIWLVVFFWMC